MKRRALALAAALTLCGALPAAADHGTFWAGHSADRTIVMEDRSGDAVYRGHIRTAMADWNAAGAWYQLSYRDGPADNACTAAAAGVVRFCILPNTEQWAGIGAIMDPDSSSGGHISGAWVGVRVDQMGPFGPRHEFGHFLGLDHSRLTSIMNTLGNGNASSTLTEHDYETVRALYAHCDGTCPTTTTTAPNPSIAGAAWYANGAPEQTGASGSVVQLYATGARPSTTFRLVSVTVGPWCSASAGPVAVSSYNRLSSSSGFIGTTAGTVVRRPGTYLLCFLEWTGSGWGTAGTATRPFHVPL